MSEPTSIAGIIKLFLKFLPSFLGSVIAVLTLKYDKGTPISKKIVPACIAFFTGVVISHYGGGAIAEYYADLSPFMIDAIKVALAIFGLTLISNITAEIKPWLEAIRKKLLGDKE